MTIPPIMIAFNFRAMQNKPMTFNIRKEQSSKDPWTNLLYFDKSLSRRPKLLISGRTYISVQNWASVAIKKSPVIRVYTRNRVQLQLSTKICLPYYIVSRVRSNSLTVHLPRKETVVYWKYSDCQTVINIRSPLLRTSIYAMPDLSCLI